MYHNWKREHGMCSGCFDGLMYCRAELLLSSMHIAHSTRFQWNQSCTHRTGEQARATHTHEQCVKCSVIMSVHFNTIRWKEKKLPVLLKRLISRKFWQHFVQCTSLFRFALCQQIQTKKWNVEKCINQSGKNSCNWTKTVTHMWLCQCGTNAMLFMIEKVFDAANPNQTRMV